MIEEDDDHPKFVDESSEKGAVDTLPPSPESTLTAVPEIDGATFWTPEKFKEICKTIPFLQIPCYLGFMRTIITEPVERECAYPTGTGAISRSKVIYENTKDGIRLTSMDEAHAYLQEKKIIIPVSCFTFETRIRPDQKYFRDSWKDMTITEDLSDGLENIPIPVICKESASETPLVTYVKTYFVGENVKVSMEHADGFFICCDCPDDCKDKLNCPCFQKTLDNCSQRTRDAEGDANTGYEFQRLYKSILSGIFECNKMCKCRKNTCMNRVVQNELVWRLQLFMTELKGYGVRTLEDIPKGSFICTYAGKVVSKKFADKVSKDWEGNWKYLNGMEIGDVNKEGYEAEVVTPEEEPKANKVKKTEDVFDEWSMESEGSDSEMESGDLIPDVSQNAVEISGQEWNDFMDEEEDEDMNKEVNNPKNDEESGGLQDQIVLTPSTQQSVGSISLPCLSSATTTAAREVVVPDRDGNQTGEEDSGTNDAINIPDTDPVPGTSSSSATTSKKGPPNPPNPLHLFIPSDQILRNVFKESSQDYQMLPTVRSGYLNRPLEQANLLSRLNANSRKMSECRLLPEKMPDRPRKTTVYKFEDDYHANQPGGAIERFREMIKKNGEEMLKRQKKIVEELKLSSFIHKSSSGVPAASIAQQPCPRRRRVHPLLKLDLHVDGMDYGNIGRYMNHSCDPNVFPQHVFVNSHDLRLPETGLFANRNISAGEELCWDYNYELEGEVEEEDGDDQKGSDKEKGTSTPTASTSAASRVDKQPGPIVKRTAKMRKGQRKRKGKGVKRRSAGLRATRFLRCYCSKDNCRKIICTGY